MSKPKPTWVEVHTAGPTPCAIEIGEPQREIEITPLRPPVPLPAPEPSPEPERMPEREPERAPEREPERVGRTAAGEDEPGNTYLEPVHGERTLAVKFVSGQPRLYSLGGGAGRQKVDWDPGVAFVAGCGADHDHISPDKHCRCGIYSVTPSHIQEMKHYTDRPYVIVDLSLWGKVEEHSYGYRAQYAYPYEIRVPPGLNWKTDTDEWIPSEQVAQMLARVYQVDVKLQPPPWGLTGRHGRLPEGWSREPLDPEDLGEGWTAKELVGEELDDFHSIGLKYEHHYGYPDEPIVIGFYFEGKPAGFIEGEGNPQGFFSVKEIKGDEWPISSWIESAKQQGGDYHWDSGAEQAMNEDEPYSEETELIEDYSYDDISINDIDDLLKAYREIENSPEQFTETTPEESYNPEVRESNQIDEYGLPLWEYVLREYPPNKIVFPVREWVAIVQEVLGELQTGVADDYQEVANIAQALYVVPTFIAGSDARHWNDTHEWDNQLPNMGQLIDQLETYAQSIEPQQVQPQQEALFDPSGYANRSTPLRNRSMSWFLDYLRRLFRTGFHPKDPTAQWSYDRWENDPQTVRETMPPQQMPNPPESPLDMGGTLSRVATNYRKPDWWNDSAPENEHPAQAIERRRAREFEEYMNQHGALAYPEARQNLIQNIVNDWKTLPPDIVNDPWGTQDQNQMYRDFDPNEEDFDSLTDSLWGLNDTWGVKHKAEQAKEVKDISIVGKILHDAQKREYLTGDEKDKMRTEIDKAMDAFRWLQHQFSNEPNYQGWTEDREDWVKSQIGEDLYNYYQKLNYLKYHIGETPILNPSAGASLLRASARAYQEVVALQRKLKGELPQEEAALPLKEYGLWEPSPQEEDWQEDDYDDYDDPRGYA